MRVTIDGQTIDVAAGATVLDAVNRAGICLPQLCKDPDRPALGACRTCLVKIEGVRGYPAACSTPVREGMAVSTTAADLVRIRAGVLDLTLGMLRPDGNGRRGFRELDEACRHHGITASRYAPHHTFPVDDTKSFFVLDREACILCGRCVVACDEVQHIGAIALLGRGHRTKVGTFGDRAMEASICTSCGQCVATCPTGALRPKQVPAEVTRQVETTCPYCGVGCGIVLSVDERGKLAVMADDVPANRSSEGTLCVKGRFGTGFLHHPDRVTTPLIRRDGRLVPCSWDEALDFAAERLVRSRGRFAALASAKGTNEDGYVIQKFCRAVMGTNNVDHCTRLCHSPSVEAMLASMGSGATSNSYVDYEEAGCLMVVGSDASSNHPVIAIRLRKAVDERGAKLIVVNPKRIGLCDYADLWLRQRPGTDVALFNGLAQVILDEGLWDERFVVSRTEGFEAWRAAVEPYTPEVTQRITGVPADDLRRAARIYARPPFSGSCLIWGMGITQHINGTANAHALLNLALLTGQLGRPGSGISPLRGQNNVQGCGDAGCIPNMLPGYQAYRADLLDKFERTWGIRPPDREGLVVTEMVEGALHGDVTAMYVTGENPLLSEPNLHHARKAIEQIECLIVQDLFLHETAELCHVFLPAAGFAEKDGTFTNSERRVQRVRKAVDPPGQARADWEITGDLARRVARRLGLPAAGFAHASAGEIFAEMASLVPFLGGLDYGRLEAGGIQWPCPALDHPGTRFLYAENFPRGKGKFFPVTQGVQAAELPEPDYPFILNTGRVLYHWHGGTITRRVEGLVALCPDLQVAIHPADAARLGVGEGDPIRVRSRRGGLEGVALVTDAVRVGDLFVPFVKLKETAANFLTNDVFDPSSKIPEYKVCAVRVERAPAAAG